MSIERKQFEAKLEQLRPILDESHPGTGAGIIVMLKVAWNVAYEAGEIAMKERTARMAECVDKEGMVMTAMLGDPPTKCRVKLADAIRALPLSGAEEAKKKTSGG